MVKQLFQSFNFFSFHLTFIILIALLFSGIQKYGFFNSYISWIESKVNCQTIGITYLKANSVVNPSFDVIELNMSSVILI